MIVVLSVVIHNHFPITTLQLDLNGWLGALLTMHLQNCYVMYSAHKKLIQVSETIELTRVIFPICAVDSILSIIAIIFSFLMSGKTIDYKTYTPIARWVCLFDLSWIFFSLIQISTIQSLCATILILGRHRLFIRRIREILGLKGLEKSRKMKPVDKHNVSFYAAEIFNPRLFRNRISISKCFAPSGRGLLKMRFSRRRHHSPWDRQLFRVF